MFCCVNKKICLPIKKVNNRGRPLPRYGLFSCAILFIFLLCLVHVLLHPREKNPSIRVSSKLAIRMKICDFDWEHENFRLLVLVYCVEGPLIEGLQQTIWLNLGWSHLWHSYGRTIAIEICRGVSGVECFCTRLGSNRRDRWSYVRHLACSHAMLMSPDEDETAVHGCHYRGWHGCAHS